MFAIAPTRAARYEMLRECQEWSVCRGSSAYNAKENNMSVGTILLIVLVLVLIGAIPAWSHSKSWGYGPSGGLGLVIIILLILLLTGRL